jgi:SAM-dependent methyltransferase
MACWSGPARGVYGLLRNQVLGETLDFAGEAFAAIVSAGVFTSGHAPASAFDELIRITSPGGHLIFTVGVTVWEEQGFRHTLEGLLARSLLEEIEVTAPYHPMPLSPTEAQFTTTARVYRRV